MDTKSLLIGITSFIAGALLVSVAANTFDKSHICEDFKNTSSHAKHIH